MGELVAFRPRSRDGAPKGAAAQILFFTGVRYERQEPEGEESPSQAPAQKGRGTQKLGGRHPRPRA